MKQERTKNRYVQQSQIILTQDKKIKSKDLKQLQYIDSGGFGQIYKGKYKGNPVIVKIMFKQVLHDNSHTNHILREIKCNLDFKSQHSIQCYGAGQTDHSIYIVLEYISHNSLYFPNNNNCSLFEFLNFNAKEGYQLQFYSAQVTKMVAEMHLQGYVHRDIKPQNILMDKNGNLRIIDFGFAKKICRQFQTKTMCGTPQYMSPQIINALDGYYKQVDWWALGVLIYQMATGTQLFQGENPNVIYNKINNHKLIKKQEFLNQIIYKKQNYQAVMNVLNLINGLVNPNKIKRMGCSVKGVNQIKQHAFFKNFNFKTKNKTPFQLFQQRNKKSFQKSSTKSFKNTKSAFRAQPTTIDRIQGSKNLVTFYKCNYFQK